MATKSRYRTYTPPSADPAPEILVELKVEESKVELEGPTPAQAPDPIIPIEEVKPPEPEPPKILKNCSNPDFPPHQKHTLPHVHDTVSDHIAYGNGGKHTISGHGFLCSDVVYMEKKYGRHAEGCAHVGYVASTVCGCNK